MRAFTQEMDSNSIAIVTNAIVFEAADIVKGVPIKNRFYSENVIWDTGAEVSVISSKIIRLLHLQPCATTLVTGIGGDVTTNIYKVHLGLPNGYLYKNLYIYENDIEDYDILIGMDVISQSDFCYTNADKSLFSFRIPSEEQIRLE